MSRDLESQGAVQTNNTSDPAFTARLTNMCLCVAGIMGSLVLYGLLQERIMTQPYGENGELFKSSAYLVFNNRVIAIIIAVTIIKFKGESLVNAAPIYKCSGISFSNTLATFCQYEALKYVSFPTQTLGKCGKMIPVLILGMLVLGKKYIWKDFIIALTVTIGCVAFVMTGDITGHKGHDDSFYGLLLMGGYLFCDGFTSVFQEKLFKGYKMSTYNQMLYVNLCSACISFMMLLLSGELLPSFSFAIEYPAFMFNSLALSFCATAGQLVIYYSIKEFGALFFSTVMTTRQVVSILLSCIIYLHPLTIWQWLSALLVFGALYYQEVFLKQRSGHGHSHGGHAGHNHGPNQENEKSVPLK
eukprot:TRINITY_DN57_c0_g2_i2.p1 TRINITY_DN57_c0_g2~~TRINITY_DN57_c0_g2_i2.p1  ORF type:complete len:358 (-),score=132.58 TRINITY_DN57_c0_g2_i2:211-1284(-)